MDQPCMVANPARSQLNRKMNISLSPFAPENLGLARRVGWPFSISSCLRSRSNSWLHDTGGSKSEFTTLQSS